MKAVTQSERIGVQFMLGMLHLYAMGVAGVAFTVHALAVAHHWQRAGLLDANHSVDTDEMVDLTYEQAVARQGG